MNKSRSANHSSTWGKILLSITVPLSLCVDTADTRQGEKVLRRQAIMTIHASRNRVLFLDEAGLWEKACRYWILRMLSHLREVHSIRGSISGWMCSCHECSTCALSKARPGESEWRATSAKLSYGHPHLNTVICKDKGTATMGSCCITLLGNLSLDNSAWSCCLRQLLGNWVMDTLALILCYVMLRRHLRSRCIKLWIRICFGQLCSNVRIRK